MEMKNKAFGKTLTLALISNHLCHNTPKAINHFRDMDSESLLSRKKLHLVIDLDQTLIHSTLVSKLTPEFMEKSHIIFKGSSCAMAVKLRPGAANFLEKASSMFDLTIYTMGCRAYAREVVRLLDPTGTYFGDEVNRRAVFSREDCTVEKRKGLDVVLSHPRLVLVLDDRVDVWASGCKANVIQIQPYYFFPQGYYRLDRSSSKDDRELARVLKDLIQIHDVFYDENHHHDHGRDVREILRRDPKIIKMSSKSKSMSLPRSRMSSSRSC